MAITKTKQRKKKRKKEARKLVVTTSNNDVKIKSDNKSDESNEQEIQPYQCSEGHQLQSFSYTTFSKSTAGRPLWDKVY